MLILDLCLLFLRQRAVTSRFGEKVSLWKNYRRGNVSWCFQFGRFRLRQSGSVHQSPNCSNNTHRGDLFFRHLCLASQILMASFFSLIIWYHEVDSCWLIHSISRIHDGDGEPRRKESDKVTSWMHSVKNAIRLRALLFLDVLYGTEAPLALLLHRLVPCGTSETAPLGHWKLRKLHTRWILRTCVSDARDFLRNLISCLQRRTPRFSDVYEGCARWRRIVSCGGKLQFFSSIAVEAYASHPAFS